jgi:hypothetical protein
MKPFSFAFLIFTLSATAAYAGVSDLSRPSVEAGEMEVEYNGTRTGDRSGSTLNNAQSHEIEMKYGLTDRWMVGLNYEAERAPGDGLSTEATGIEAQYEMTTQKDWWLASAIKAEYGFAAHSGDPDALEAALLLQRREGPLRCLANLDFERDTGANRDHGIGFATQFQALYHWQRYLSPGLEWQGDFGRLNRLSATDEDGQYLGPVITGYIPGLGRGVLGYTLGYYRGLTSNSADDAARLELEYEFRF